MRPFNSLILTLFCALLLAAFSGTAHAELPPSAYEQLRAAAPEVLEIEVTDVHQTSEEISGGRNLEITAQVVVKRVKRTASHLKKGQTITLRYQSLVNTQPGWVGPSAVPVVHKGTCYRAWLARAGPAFTAAARGQSFEILR